MHGPAGVEKNHTRKWKLIKQMLEQGDRQASLHQTRVASTRSPHQQTSTFTGRVRIQPLLLLLKLILQFLQLLLLVLLLILLRCTATFTIYVTATIVSSTATIFTTISIRNNSRSVARGRNGQRILGEIISWNCLYVCLYGCLYIYPCVCMSVGMYGQKILVEINS